MQAHGEGIKEGAQAHAGAAKEHAAGMAEVRRAAAVRIAARCCTTQQMCADAGALALRRAQKISQKAGEMKETIAQKAGDAKESVAGMAQSAKESVGMGSEAKQ